ncbi:MAG TPA: cyclic pyranopterin monophosphate synthase MoaC [Lachnospiraceae bacterium]|jgi:cyclic pyranopterin monophosphate synthase|nr:cyclic pyranopterin monophosphate synthase MoaC [Lachnospiraceae bacterium]
MGEFTHFDQAGNAIMVDVSEKTATNRTAIAEGSIQVSREVLEAVKMQTVKKGDVLSVARVAGIMAVKQTDKLIPLCHSLPIDTCSIEFFINDDIDERMPEIKAQCTVKTFGKTGVEMEAMTGVSVSLLTIYDMCKAIDKRMTIGQIHLVKKTGGKSGDFYA